MVFLGNKKGIRVYILSYLLLCGISFIQAAEPSSYYNAAEGTTSNDLRLELHDIIDGHTVVSYNGLYDVYKTSDNKNSNQVWDMYSTCTWTQGAKKCGSYKSVCDCYNREHSVPQSWFGSSSPMVSDAFHVYPTDGKVNGQRSNYPFGECSNGSNLGGKALGQLGRSTFSGYSGTVFEPADEYKGDFARTYFYMATRYVGKNFNQTSNGQVAFTSDANLTTYSINLFLKWHREDPVSQKELDRNEAVYKHQHNRNPFIDHPELAEYIWGNKKGNNWYKNATNCEIPNADQIAIYPNPAKDYLTINGMTGEYQISIINLTGNTVMNETASGLATLQLSGLPQGVYIIQLEQNKSRIMRKFVITQ